MGTALRAGAVVGARYRLERVVASGGMGTVWAARHEITRKRVALKFLRAALSANAQLRRRFLSEARVASAIEHPAVLPVLDAFDHDEAPVLVMDLLDGETLAQALARRTQLDLADTLAILRPVASALAAAHERGVIHRDLKPANIFLSRAKAGALRPMVLDFGIAKLLEPDADGVETGTGLTLGTPCYMAPEQAIADREVDHRADIWSLGVVAYECLAGVRPVEVDTVGQLVHRLANEAITPLAALVPELPPAVGALVGRMLARDRDRRPKDMAEIASALDELAADTAAPPTWDWQQPSIEEADDELSGARTVESPAARPTWGLAAALGAIAVVAMAVWMLTQRNDSPVEVDALREVAAPTEPPPQETTSKTREPMPTASFEVPPPVSAARSVRPLPAPTARASAEPARSAAPELLPPPPPPRPRDPTGVVEDPPF